MKRMIVTGVFLSLLIRMMHPVIFAEPAPKGYLALTFDDGPSGALTQRLLDGLYARGVHATFFVCAYRVEQFPQTLCRTVQEGHELGIHGCCHDYMHKMTCEAVYDDLISCMEAVTECCGVSPRLFRPPGGLCSENLMKAAENADLSVILWSVDPEDWDQNQAATVLPRVLSGAAPGAVILMHDLSENSVDCALQAVDTLQAQGWRFCTVSELAENSGVQLRPGVCYSAFPPHSER